MKSFRIRREIEVYYTKKDLIPPNSTFWQKISLFFFKLKFNKLILGSPKWHILQDKVSNYPTDGIGSMKRTLFYEKTLISCGNNLLIYPLTSIHFPQNLKIGDNVKFNRGVFITANTFISIGNNVMIGPYTVLNSGNHIYKDSTKLIQNQGHKTGEIYIEDDVWIGSHVTILAGVSIGKGSVIGAGAVVNKSIPDYSVAVGVPAKVIKKR